MEVTVSPLGSFRGLPRATWRLPLLWSWSAEDKVVLSSIFWQSGFPSFVLGHFFLLGVGLGLDMKWAGLFQILQPHNSSSKSCCPAPRDGEEDFDVLGPISWPVESCSPMGARVSSSTQDMLLALWRTRCIVINAFLGWRGSLRYTECVFNGAFMKRRGFGGWGFPWELSEIYFAWHSLFELCARWTPPNFVLYIRHPERIIFHIC